MLNLMTKYANIKREKVVLKKEKKYEKMKKK